MSRTRGALVGLALVGLVGLSGCGGHQAPSAGPKTSATTAGVAAAPARPKPYVAPQFRHRIPGMPPVVDNDVYSQTRAGMLAPQVRRDPRLLYVPDSAGSRVTVISQRSRRVVRVIPTGYLDQHVVPSYDLRTLFTNSSYADQLVAINPRTGTRSGTISMPRP